MMVSIFNQTDFDLKVYEDALHNLFKHIDNPKIMQIIFLNHKQMHEMNLNYRGIDKTTDVLSFENDEPLDESLGDVFIDYEQAIIQAHEYEHTLLREICFLAVHGYLHIIGYDHQTEIDTKKMFDLQETILNQAGIRREHK